MDDALIFLAAIGLVTTLYGIIFFFITLKD